MTKSSCYSTPIPSSSGGETVSLLSNTSGATNPTTSRNGSNSTRTGGVEEGGDHDGHQFFHHHHGSATVMETILNEANTCMGTGCLALPFAARLGGIILHVGGIVAIAMWNVYSVHRLCQCLYLLPKDAVLYEKEILVVEEPPANSSSTSKQHQMETKQEHEGDCSLELSPPPSHNHDIDNTTTTRPIHRQSFDETESTSTTLPFGDASTTYVNTKKHPSYSSTTTATTTATVHSSPQHPQQQAQQPPRGTSTYSRVAWYAFGPMGLLVLDILMIILFVGVVVTFINAIRGFLRDTPFTTGHDVMDAIGIALILGPMSSVKDMGYLSKASATGIVALFLSFTVIATYGLFFFQQRYDDDDGDGHHLPKEVNSSNMNSGGLNWFPENGMEGVSTWFGSTVFGYGVAPLTYNFLESMAQPQHMVPASTMALLIVAIAYVVMGVGIYSLFPNDVDGDILRVLPSEGWLPTLTRLSMAVVVSVTAPLLIVPCGQLVEGKILKASAVSNDVPYYLRATVRIGIALLCVSISVLVPGFVSVLSLVGCTSVATVGFVVPPALFLRLRLLRCPTWTWDLTFDAIMLLWGIVATGITTSYTFEDVMSSKV